MKKYIELYEQYKDKIKKGQLKSGDKLPSVREAAALYRVSRTTVQNAYFQLSCEGYIYAKPKSGVYVSSMGIKSPYEEKAHTEIQNVKYDLTGGSADADSFDFNLWQRYIKSAIRQKDRMLRYSDVAGEYDLRCALSEYIRTRRNISASPDRIVVGAGVQALLNILCSLLKNKGTVSFPDSSFVQGISVFESHAFKVKTRYKDADIIYVSPSHMTRWGDVMPIKRRLELVEYSKTNGSLVIEDDYENEFLYGKTPTPSLFALGKGNVVYMGSFSAMLLPGIRISFMVLNDELADRYEKEKHKFAQTASKTEQLALCSYLRDGNMESRTRKIRRLYTAKTKAFYEQLKSQMPQMEMAIGENGLQVIISLNEPISPLKLKEKSVSLYQEQNKKGQHIAVISPSALPDSEMENATKEIAILAECK